ncbi:MAG: carboxylating nicotinate-nucleotide diphosphorylase [Clostridia bacterium]|nr:carboxylating nicotinate-nucleotide diphosphorylase [Deltaproteobacteria bacterium]
MTPADWRPVLEHADVQLLIDLALREDLGSGDVTTQAIFRAPQQATVNVVSRTPTVACGQALAETIFHRLDPYVRCSGAYHDGDLVPAGATMFAVTGDVRALLTAERTVVNFLMRLCGVAANTRRAVGEIPLGAKARVFDTRKTLPGWRQLDKMAVRVGGGANHRIGLFDAVLIKDNHIAAAGSITKAIEAARTWTRGRMQIEVEIDRLDQLDEALLAKADIILLDNFDTASMKRAVEITAGRAELEASGGLTHDKLAEVAATGVDRISLGALTHTVVPADLALDFPSMLEPINP